MTAEEIVKKLESTAARGLICYCPMAWIMKQRGKGDGSRLCGFSEAAKALGASDQLVGLVAHNWDWSDREGGYSRVKAVQYLLEAGFRSELEA